MNLDFGDWIFILAVILAVLALFVSIWKDYIFLREMKRVTKRIKKYSMIMKGGNKK